MTPRPPADPGLHGRELYDQAELYDIAYDWDVTRELQFVLMCMEFYGPRPPTRILEPACGTGRNLAGLGRMGLETLGYDLNAGALAFAARRLKAEGLAGRCRVLPGGMADFHVPERFHGAYTAINSFRYLLTDEDVAAHLRATWAMLEPGGVYVVDLSYAMPPRLRPRVIRWNARRGGVKVKVSWRTKEDRAARRSHETCTLDVQDAGGARSVETRHTTRLWQAEEFRAMVGACGFRLEALYDTSFRNLPDHPPPHGGLDNLYHVLARAE
jgi:ubiquinone/menaquinone biosynthesis C-methylase UbiE